MLIGPAASAVRLVHRPARAVALAAALGTLTTVAAIVLAYDSYSWPPRGRVWPVSFFVVTITLAQYLLAGAVVRRSHRPVRS